MALLRYLNIEQYPQNNNPKQKYLRVKQLCFSFSALLILACFISHSPSAQSSHNQAPDIDMTKYRVFLSAWHKCSVDNSCTGDALDTAGSFTFHEDIKFLEFQGTKAEFEALLKSEGKSLPAHMDTTVSNAIYNHQVFFELEDVKNYEGKDITICVNDNLIRFNDCFTVTLKKEEMLDSKMAGKHWSLDLLWDQEEYKWVDMVVNAEELDDNMYDLHKNEVVGDVKNQVVEAVVKSNDDQSAEEKNN